MAGYNRNYNCQTVVFIASTCCKKLKLRMIKIQLYANLEPSQTSKKRNRQHLNSKSPSLCQPVACTTSNCSYMMQKKKVVNSRVIKMQRFDIKYTNRF